MDYSKFGVRDTQILFHVVEQPAHGVVDVSEWKRHDVKIFSHFDIKTDKVYYEYIQKNSEISYALLTSIILFCSNLCLTFTLNLTSGFRFLI